MRRWIALLTAALMLALTLCACGSRGAGRDDTTLRLFYPADLSAARGGDVVDSVPVDWEQRGEEEAEAQALAALELLQEDRDGKHSPIPPQTRVQSCTLGGGTVRVDLSEEYGQLSGMDLTIADCCITLTLTQIPGIRTVVLTVDGEALAYQEKNVFRTEDVLLTSMQDVARPLDVVLYFPDGEGQLTAEERELTLYEGQSQSDVLLQALIRGPQNEALRPLLPDGFEAETVRQEEGLCFVNLPASNEELLDEGADSALLLQGITDSLCSLEGVEQVQFLLSGELQPLFAGVDISLPFDPD